MIAQLKADHTVNRGWFGIRSQPDGADLGITPGEKPVQTPDGVQSALQHEYRAWRAATLMPLKPHDMIRS